MIRLFYALIVGFIIYAYGEIKYRHGKIDQIAELVEEELKKLSEER